MEREREKGDRKKKGFPVVGEEDEEGE